MWAALELAKRVGPGKRIVTLLPDSADFCFAVASRLTASGVRNPQRFAWDSKTGRLFVADIGQNMVEEISPVTAGANLGWNKWEGSFAFAKGQVDLTNPRSEPGLTWPVAEFDHLGSSSA